MLPGKSPPSGILLKQAHIPPVCCSGTVGAVPWDKSRTVAHSKDRTIGSFCLTYLLSGGEWRDSQEGGDGEGKTSQVG